MSYGSFSYGSTTFAGGLAAVITAITTRSGLPSVILTTDSRRAALYTINRPAILGTTRRSAVL